MPEIEIPIVNVTYAGPLVLTAYKKPDFAITSGGVELPGAGYGIISKCPITGGGVYEISGPTVSVDKNIVQYNISGTIIAGTVKAMPEFPYKFTAHADAKTVSFTVMIPGDDPDAMDNVTLSYQTNTRAAVSIDGIPFSDFALKTVVDYNSVEKVPLNGVEKDGFAITSAGAYVGGAPGYVSVINMPILPETKYVLGGISTSLGGSKFFSQVDKYGGVISVREILALPMEVISDPIAAFFSFTVRADEEVGTSSMDNVFFGKSKKNVDVDVKRWIGKNVACFGDSITWYDQKVYGAEMTEETEVVNGYETYLRTFLGCAVDNKGANGWNMTEIQNVIKAYDFSNTHVATITSGANDHRKSILPGTVLPIGSSFILSTYAGAMQSSIEYILNDNPETRIILITPVKGFYYENGTVDVPDLYNDETVISPEYVAVIKEIAQLYSLPVCDWYYNSGINELTKDTFLGDKPGQPYSLHPTQGGYRLMGHLLIDVFNAI